MHIFIDESGRFANPGNHDEAISLVGALCVADTRRDELYEKFDKLKGTWGAGKKEWKGVELNETQLRDTLILLRKHDAKAKIVLTDLGLFPEAQVIAHRERQADILTVHLTDKHHPNLVKEIKELQDRVRKLSPPLYVQMILLTELVYRAIQIFTLWHAFRDGRELGKFHWVVDPKDVQRTEYEKLWQTLVLPFVEDKSRKEPYGFCEEGADYSAFERFRGKMDKRPDWLPPASKGEPEGPFMYTDPKLILMEDLQYLPSKDCLGLQLVDIVVSNMRKALFGKIRARGGEPLAGLTIAEKSGTINLLGIGHLPGGTTVKRSYAELLKWFTLNSSSMLPPRLRKKK